MLLLENDDTTIADGGSGALRALRRLLLKRKTGMESHLRQVVKVAVELGKDGTTIRCQKV